MLRVRAILNFIFILFIVQGTISQDIISSNENFAPDHDPDELLNATSFTQEQINLRIREFISDAGEDERLGHKAEAIRKLQHALFLEKQVEQPSAERFDLNYFAARLISSFDLRYGLEFYKKATVMIPLVPHLDPSDIFTIYTSRAGVHGALAEYDSATVYYRKAITAAYNDSPVAEISSYNNMGVFFLETARNDSAKVYFHKALHLMKQYNKPQLGLYCAILDNLAQLDILKGNYQSALKTFRFNDSVYLAREMHNKYVINKVRMMETMAKLDVAGIQQEIKGLATFINQFNLHIKPKEVIRFYGFANDYYHSTGAYDLSKQYQEKYLHWSDSLSAASAEQLHQLSQSLLALEEISFRNEMKAQQLAADKAKLKLKFAQRIILISMFSAVSIVILLLLYFKKRKQELLAQKQIAESELRHKEMEAKIIEQELILKKRDLTNLVLHNTQVHDSNHRLIERLHGITHQKENVEKEIRSLLIDLESQNHVVEKAVMLQANIDSLNEEFYQKLKAKFPDLSKAETELCGFIRINLSSKDISILKNVGAPSVKTSKNRLRKKLGISPEADIYEFVKDI